MNDTVKQDKKDSLKALLESLSNTPVLDKPVLGDALADRMTAQNAAFTDDEVAEDVKAAGAELKA